MDGMADGKGEKIVTFASLCTGIGGMDKGLEAAGVTPLWFCEIDAKCREALVAHWIGRRITRYHREKQHERP